MPSIANVVRKFTRQTLVYWEKTGSDGDGQPVYADPVELKCRWEDTDAEVVTSDRRKVISKAYLLLRQRVLVGSLVFLGTVVDWQSLPTYPRIPTVNEGGLEVIKCKFTPDLLAKGFVFEGWL